MINQYVLEDQIAKHQGMIGGYERIQTYERILNRHLMTRTNYVRSGFDCTYINKHIANSKFRIKRMFMLTEYLNENY